MPGGKCSQFTGCDLLPGCPHPAIHNQRRANSVVARNVLGLKCFTPNEPSSFKVRQLFFHSALCCRLSKTLSIKDIARSRAAILVTASQRVRMT